MAVKAVAQSVTARRSIATFFPILGWLPKYDRAWLRPDIMAGITIRVQITNRLAATTEPIESVLLDLELTNEIDVPSADMLKELHDGLDAAGVKLMLARVRPPVRDLLDRSGVTKAIGEEHIFRRVLEGAVFHLSDRLAEVGMLLELSGDQLKRLQEVVNGMLVITEEHQQAQLEALAAQLGAAIDKTTHS